MHLTLHLLEAFVGCCHGVEGSFLCQPERMVELSRLFGDMAEVDIAAGRCVTLSGEYRRYLTVLYSDFTDEGNGFYSSKATMLHNLVDKANV